MDMPLHRFVEVTRQNIVRAETQAAYHELGRSTPCDGCPLFERCKVERIACKAFVSYVHGERYAWQRVKSHKPTRELYELAMAEELRGGVALRRRSAEERAREWIGRKVGGREVVDIKRAGSGGVLLLLHCSRCGRDASARLYVVESDGATPCACMNGARQRAANKRAKAELEAQREQERLAKRKPWEVQRDERAARLAAAARIDALMRDPEQWKPCVP